jgi:hypothetical protein
MNRNNVLDKIVLLMGDLSSDKHSDLFYSNVYNEFTKFDGSMIQIHIGNNLWINHKNMYYEYEDKTISEPMFYRAFNEEEFFQYTTLYDFGDVTLDDFAFISRHIDKLTSLGISLFRRSQERMDQMYNQMTQRMTYQMMQQIDQDLLDSLSQMVKPSGKSNVITTSVLKSRFDPSNPTGPSTVGATQYTWNADEIKLHR